MALIKCEDCGKEVSDKAASCPNCGAPIASKKDDVMIRFPVWKGQMLKIYLSKVDTISGNANSDGIDVSVGVFKNF